jgi:hypothetical protein
MSSDETILERERLEENEKAPRKSYRCTRCEERFDKAALSQAYYRGELVCEACRDLLRQDESEVRRRDTAIIAVRRERRLPRALARAAVLFLGFAGPAWTILHLGGGVALAVGVVIALAGGLVTYGRG